MPVYTSLVSLIAVGLYFSFALRVAMAHAKYGVKLPATSGQPDFERVFRIHMNTLEWLPTFLIPLWLSAFYLSDVGAAALGLLWIIGRILYAVGYGKAVERRLPGFFIQATACILLFVGGLVGIVTHIIGW